MADFTFRFLSDVSEAVKGIKEFASETAKAAKGIEKQFNGVNKTFLNVSNAINIARAGFAVISGAVNTLSGALTTVIDDAAAFEDRVNKVRIALNLSGIESEEAVKGLVEYASAVQETTRFSDAAVLSASALIQSLGGLTESGLKRATNAALDLSTSLGIDLQTAAQLVGKAAAGEIGTFSRYGVVIQKGATDAETLANTLTALESKFGGAAARSVNTYAGAIDQLSNIFGDIKKEIGLGIIQNTEFISTIKQISAELVALIPSAITLGKEIGGTFVVGINLLKEGFKELPAIIAAATAALVLWNAQFLIATGASALAALKAIITGFVVLKGTILLAAAPIAILAAKVIAIGAAAFGVYKLVKALTDTSTEAKKVTSDLEDARSESRKLSKEFTKGPLSEPLKLKVTVDREAAEKAKRELDQLKKEFESFAAQFKFAGLNPVQRIAAEQNEALAKLKDFQKKGVVSVAEFEQTRLNIEQFYADKRLEETKKRNQEITSSFGTFLGKLAAGIEKLKEEDIPALGVGFVSQVLKGADGAKNVLSQFGGAIAESFLPGAGAAISEIINVLAQGPEAVREQVRAFSEAIPQLLENIIASFPVLVEELVNTLIPALIRAIPRITAALIREMPKIGSQFAVQVNKAAFSFTGEILKGAAQFVVEIVKGAGRAFSGAAKGIGGGIVGGISKIGGGLKKLNPFAEGGVVPSGFPNDTYPAALTSGEAVIPNNLVDRLDRFLSEPVRQVTGKGSSGGDKPQNLTIVLQVGQEELARTLVSLDRQGFRLAV